MKIETIILAFLAARAPAAYSESAIAARINASGLADAKVTADEVNSACSRLALDRGGGLVDSDVEVVTKQVVWYATDAGIRRWALDGRLHVGS